jgi:hypothetical protein
MANIKLFPRLKTTPHLKGLEEASQAAGEAACSGLNQ